MQEKASDNMQMGDKLKENTGSSIIRWEIFC